MGKKISVTYEELEGFAAELEAIGTSLEKVISEAQAIGKIQFYKKGQAKTAVDTLSSASNKYAALTEHYGRLYNLVGLTCQKMKAADQEAATVVEGPPLPKK